MNPRTGKTERVMGTTSDGFDVFQSDGLKLKPTLLVWEKASAVILNFGIDVQTNEFGKKRPAVYLHIGTLLFQSGWLFA